MDFYCASVTDVGIKRANNQDALFVRQYKTKCGRAAFAVLCDGMGGLQHGEIASASIVEAFSDWAERYLPETDAYDIADHFIRQEWTRLIAEENEALYTYGRRNGCSIGSTAVALLLTETRYYILNIGDSRVYLLDNDASQLTEDHTVIAEEIRKGNMSEQQAAASPMKSVLTRCVGVSRCAYPDFFFGDTRSRASYMLCSDGFRHCISRDEMLAHLLPRPEASPSDIAAGLQRLIELNKERGETDNISAVVIYTDA